MFLEFVCKKSNNNLEITYVRSSLDLCNKMCQTHSTNRQQIAGD